MPRLFATRPAAAPPGGERRSSASQQLYLDGFDNNESLVNTIVFFPAADAIQEFKVQTNVAPAEFGRAGGGIVNTTLKSGANPIHGSAFEFFRNCNLDARPTSAPRFPTSAESVRRHHRRPSSRTSCLSSATIRAFASPRRSAWTTPRFRRR